jgi:predicted dienelactone hydrolase
MARLLLVDEGRTDPWAPIGPRELMDSVWYPTVAAEESRLLLDLDGITHVNGFTDPGAHPRAIRAAPLRTPFRLPLVVLSPGVAFPRWTTLAEDLASRGYVVAGVDHTYEAAPITFPDGRVVECVVCLGETSGRHAVA